MAVKIRIGRFVIVEADRDVENDISELERGAQRLEQVVESKVKNWIKNDRFFDGFRNTYARVVLWALGNVVLFGGLFLTYTNESGFIPYAISVFVMVMAQKLSVRFVFDSQGDLIDEYQRARRDRAYRRAYRNVTGAFAGFIAIVLAYGYYQFFQENGYLRLLPSAFIELNLDSYRVLVVLVFALGFFSLQPYFAWGFKGEPFRSRHEPNE